VSEEERELTARVLAGEAGAFEALHAAHAGRVRAYLRRTGFSGADADDLAQEAFLRAFRSMRSFDPSRGSFRLWLGTIARNVARSRWHRRSQPESFDPDLAEEIFAAPANPRDAPEGREEAEAVRGCVDALPPELSRVVRLRYVESRTTRGIAEATGLPEATVRLRLKEATDILAACMKEKGFLQ